MKLFGIRLLRRHSLERRLFGWLLALALVPALAVLLVGTWLWSGSLDYFGTLGPWTRVAESARAVFAAADSAAVLDPALAAALAGHRQEISASLLLAQRWAFIGERLSALLPVLALGLGLGLAVLALVASRVLARQLARPIEELVEWTDRVAREEPLPAQTAGDRRAVREVRLLRDAFRRAAAVLASARTRAVDAERVRVWGEMARRVAHEMKNPLTPLRLASRRLEFAAHADPELREPVAVIHEETARLEELARQFAALGRPPEGPTSAVDLAELLASLVGSDVPPSVEATLECAGAVPLVEGHYEELVRAFRNLIKNAVEAMEGSEGERRVEVAVRTGAGRTHPYVEVVVADTGPGIPEGMEAEVFEPDFTTKSRGTGLGLALVRQAVAAHGGTIRARTRAAGGAEFSVRLPVTNILTEAR